MEEGSGKLIMDTLSVTGALQYAHCSWREGRQQFDDCGINRVDDQHNPSVRGPVWRPRDLSGERAIHGAE